jgi:pyruvate formate lyase activating enzyme
MSPETIVNKAKGMGARSMAYTYGEPTIFYEYMFDICLLAKKTGLLNVLHSNGFINPAPLLSLCKVLDAVNIDLKGFTNAFYDDLCNGKVTPVLETLKILKREKVHLEITNLLIPTKNDEMSVVKEMCLWIKNELGSDTPLHFSRFYPLHKLKKLPPTPVSKLEEARAVAMSTGLQYVYIGNVPGHEAWNTFCPDCKRIVIKRVGFMIGKIHLVDGKCKYCGKPIPGIWS